MSDGGMVTCTPMMMVTYPLPDPTGMPIITAEAQKLRRALSSLRLRLLDEGRHMDEVRGYGGMGVIYCHPEDVQAVLDVVRACLARPGEAPGVEGGDD